MKMNDSIELLLVALWQSSKLPEVDGGQVDVVCWLRLVERDREGGGYLFLYV